jgi:hypothetical protein
MNGYTTLADRVASLLPKTTAGACVPSSPWTTRTPYGAPGCFLSYHCHYSCHGAAVCDVSYICSV